MLWVNPPLAGTVLIVNGCPVTADEGETVGIVARGIVGNVTVNAPIAAEPSGVSAFTEAEVVNEFVPSELCPTVVDVEYNPR